MILLEKDSASCAVYGPRGISTNVCQNSQPISTHIRYPTTTSKKRMSTIMVSKYKVSNNRTLVIADIDADLQKKLLYIDNDYYDYIVNDW